MSRSQDVSSDSENGPAGEENQSDNAATLRSGKSLAPYSDLLDANDRRHFNERNPAVLYLQSITSKSGKQQHGYKLARFAKCWSQYFHTTGFLVTYSEPVGTILQITPWRELTALVAIRVIDELCDGYRDLKGTADRTRDTRGQRRASDATRNQYVAAIKNIAKYAATAKVLDGAESALIRQIQLRRTSDRANDEHFTPEQARQLIDHCTSQETIKGHRDAVLFLLYFTTGARRTEIVNLDVMDLNRTTRKLKILGKGNRLRLAKLNDETFMELTAYLDENDIRQGKMFRRVSKADRLMHERDCNPAARTHSSPYLTSQGVYTILKTRLKEAGLPLELHPHSFRHGLITALAKGSETRAKRDISVIAHIVGHTNLNTTRRYMHHLDEDADQAIDDLSF